MNQRERFHAVFSYQPVDRIPIWDFGFWDQTLAEWRKQGVPKDVHPDDFFGMDRQWCYAATKVGLLPHFEKKVIEDRGGFEIVQMSDGVIARQPKDFTSMPDFIDHMLKDRRSWEEHYKWRLNPETAGRLPPEYFAQLKEWRGRDYPIIIHCGSVFGDLRSWLGLENFSYIQYDDPRLFREMTETIAHCTAVTLERILGEAARAGITFDMAHFWEDICYNHGPLINPRTFCEVGVPLYQRITGVCRKHGIKWFSVDCDGKVDELILPWREGGVQTMFPVEVGDWADPLELRRRFGRELLMMGGIDKRTLARGPQAIDAMIEHLTPLVEEGGYLPTPDHRVPPDVSLENYIYYLQRIKHLWGHDLPDVRPTGSPGPGDV